MIDSLEGYLDNIAASATQTSANGGPLAELAASLAEQINALKNKLTPATSGATFPWGGRPRYAHIVKRSDARHRIVKTLVTLIPTK